MSIGIPTFCLYNLVPNRMKIVQQTGQRIKYILTRPHMIFLYFSKVKSAFLSLRARLKEHSLCKVVTIRSISLSLIKL